MGVFLDPQEGYSDWVGEKPIDEEKTKDDQVVIEINSKNIRPEVETSETPEWLKNLTVFCLGFFCMYVVCTQT